MRPARAAILLAQVGTLSFSHPLFGVSVLLIYLDAHPSLVGPCMFSFFLSVAMRSPLPFPCVPDRPSKILLVQVGTLSSSPIPRLGLSVFFLFCVEMAALVIWIGEDRSLFRRIAAARGASRHGLTGELGVAH